MDRVAVVILTWNGRDMLRTFLPLVLEHTAGDGAVIVADNGSADGTQEMLQMEFPQVRLIQNGVNHGFAGGYNKALQQVEAEYVVLLNSDVEVTPGWLPPMVSYMDSHPEVAACQPKIRSWHDKARLEYAGAAGGYIDAYGYPFCRGRIMDVVEADSGQYDQVAEVDWVSGAAMLIRLEDYRRVGGLDARFFAHMEEIDLCWRLRAQGRKLVCLPQSVVYHVGGATLKRENPQKVYLNFRNNRLMLYKNLPPAGRRRVLALRCVFDGLAMLKFACAGQMADARAVCRALRDYARMRKLYREERKRREAAGHFSSVSVLGSVHILCAFYLQGRRTYASLMRSASLSHVIETPAE